MVPATVRLGSDYFLLVEAGGVEILSVLILPFHIFRLPQIMLGFSGMTCDILQLNAVPFYGNSPQTVPRKLPHTSPINRLFS